MLRSPGSARALCLTWELQRDKRVFTQTLSCDDVPSLLDPPPKFSSQVHIIPIATTVSAIAIWKGPIWPKYSYATWQTHHPKVKKHKGFAKHVFTCAINPARTAMIPLPIVATANVSSSQASGNPLIKLNKNKTRTRHCKHQNNKLPLLVLGS